MSPRLQAEQEAFAAGLRTFVAEARLLARFDHPSLVRVFRFWEANDTAYMVMPLYSGVTLTQARGQMRCPPTEDWLRKVLWSVLGALKVLHEASTVHRDVSPDNIFLQDTGPPVLLDLGAARRAIGDQPAKYTAILKVNYAPIEQYGGAGDLRQGPWTDLYSLAAVVHGCLCNAAPLPATVRVLSDALPPVASVAQTVQEQFGLTYSSGFVTAIGAALALRPDERPPTVDVFARMMNLVTPGAMSGFNWRAELGDIWLPAGAPTQGTPAAADPGSDLPTRRLVTVAQAASCDEPSRHALALSPGRTTPIPATAAGPMPREAAAAGWRRAGRWTTVAGVLLAGLLLWGLLGGRAKPGSPATAAVPELATPAVPPQDASPAAGGRQRPAGPPRASATAKLGPAELCANSHFMTRPMCIYRECQKPGRAHLPACVAQRRQAQDNASPNPP
ncbi:MAG: serine/threonine protein kinase [Burkholderiaceae bacterium]